MPGGPGFASASGIDRGRVQFSARRFSTCSEGPSENLDLSPSPAQHWQSQGHPAFERTPSGRLHGTAVGQNFNGQNVTGGEEVRELHWLTSSQWHPAFAQSQPTYMSDGMRHSPCDVVTCFKVNGQFVQC